MLAEHTRTGSSRRRTRAPLRMRSDMFPLYDFKDRQPLDARDGEALVTPDKTHATVGGARRDRTDDLKLAKLALSQLSYGPLEEVAAA